MDFLLHQNSSLSSSTSSFTPNTLKPTTPPPAFSAAASDDPMHCWWESVSKARSRNHALANILPSPSSDSITTLADSDRPALSLLSSRISYSALSASLTSPESGSGLDPLCQWLYDTFLSSEPHLRLVVLSYLPLLSGLYLTRIHIPPPIPILFLPFPDSKPFFSQFMLPKPSLELAKPFWLQFPILATRL